MEKGDTTAYPDGTVTGVIQSQGLSKDISSSSRSAGDSGGLGDLGRAYRVRGDRPPFVSISDARVGAAGSASFTHSVGAGRLLAARTRDGTRGRFDSRLLQRYRHGVYPRLLHGILELRDSLALRVRIQRLAVGAALPRDTRAWCGKGSSLRLDLHMNGRMCRSQVPGQ